MSDRLGSRIVDGAFFGRLKSRAVDYVKDPRRLNELLDESRKKADKVGRAGPLRSTRQSLGALVRLVRAYAKGDYRNVPWRSLVLIIAGILYFVMPIDFVPDFIAGLGFIDDAAVLAYVVKTVRNVLNDFLSWESARARPISS